MRAHARCVRVLSCERNSINDFLFLKYLIDQRSGKYKEEKKKVAAKKKRVFYNKKNAFSFWIVGLNKNHYYLCSINNLLNDWKSLSFEKSCGLWKRMIQTEVHFLLPVWSFACYTCKEVKWSPNLPPERWAFHIEDSLIIS